MLSEFRRVVIEATPSWWLLENVPGVPDVMIPGYTHQRIDINAAECGLPQNRLRHFQFGHSRGYAIAVERRERISNTARCCMASEGETTGRRAWAEFCALQGLPADFHLPGFTLSARYRAVGNGVPVPMARMLAMAINGARPASAFRLCACGCGRDVDGRARLATPACRKRVSRKGNVIRKQPVSRHQA